MDFNTKQLRVFTNTFDPYYDKANYCNYRKVVPLGHVYYLVRLIAFITFPHVL